MIVIKIDLLLYSGLSLYIFFINTVFYTCITAKLLAIVKSQYNYYYSSQNVKMY